MPTFNPGSNVSKRSRLRLINPTDRKIEVTIRGRDDAGVESAEAVRLTLAAGTSHTLSAQELESGGGGLSGRLGDGQGKWQLIVIATGAIEVMSLLDTASGHLTNLSTAPRVGTGEAVTLEVHQFGNGSVKLSGAAPVTLECPRDRYCYATIAAGSTVTLEAMPESGWSVDHWNGCDRIAQRRCSVKVREDTSLTLTFLSSAPPEMEDDVVVLSDEQLRAILTYDATTGRLILMEGTNVSGIGPGVVIVSGGLHVGPSGDPRNVEIYFMRRVLEVFATAGGPIRIETSPATLDDVIKSGTISYDAPLTVAQFAAADLPKGISLRAEAISGGVPVPSLSAGAVRTMANGLTPAQVASTTIPLSFDVEYTHPLSGDSVRLIGDVDLSIRPEFAININLLGLQEIRLLMHVEADSRLRMITDRDVQLDHFQINPLSIPLGAIPAGPVVLLPRLSVYIEPMLDLPRGAGVTVAFVPNATVGGQYLAGRGWRGIRSFGVSETDFGFDDVVRGVVETGNEAIAEIGAGLQLSVLIYDAIGPTISAGPFAGLKVFPLPETESCQWHSYWGLEAAFGGTFQAPVFGWLSFNPSISFLREKLPLATELCSPDADVIDTQPPSTPSGLVIGERSTDELRLTWSEATDNVAVRSYEVHRDDALVGDDIGSPAYVDRNLRAGTRYCYRVAAVDVAGNRSAPGRQVCGSTQEETTPTPPTPPRNLRVSSASGSSIDLTWAAVSGADVSHYVIYQHPDAGSAPRRVKSTAASMAKVGSLTAKRRYCFSVTAVAGNAMESPPSARACGTTSGSGSGPDLVVDFNVSKERVEPSETLKLSALIVNEGADPSPPTRLRYYLSTDENINPRDDEELDDTDRVDGIPASELALESDNVPAPSSSGTWYYGACVDEVPREVNVKNNCSSGVPVTVVVPPVSGPDLVVEQTRVNNSTGPITVDAGERIHLSARVRNKGQGDSASTMLRYRYRRDSRQHPGTQVASDSVGPLNPGISHGKLESVDAPSTPGTYYYWACVDEVPREVNVNNNCSPAEDTVTVVVDDSNGLEGTWSVRARYTSPGCSYPDETGEATVSGSAWDGYISSATVGNLTFSATISPSGAVQGTFSYPGFGTVGSFRGTLSANSGTGSGTWSNDFGCSGTWSARKTS